MWNYYIQENSGVAHMDKKKTKMKLRLFGHKKKRQSTRSEGEHSYILHLWEVGYCKLLKEIWLNNSPKNLV